MPPKVQRNGGRNNSKPSTNELIAQLSDLSEENQLLANIILNSIKNVEDRFSATLEEKNQRIKKLEESNRKLEERIEKLEGKFDDEEAISRRTNVIFSGPNIPPSTPGEVCANTIRSMLQTKFQLEVPLTSIVAARRLGSRNPSSQPQADKRSLLATFVDVEKRNDVLISCKRSRVDGIFVKEDLTSTRNSIMYILRRAKRDFPDKISGCSSRNGNVYVYVKGNSQNASNENRSQRILVNTFARLDKFCTETLARPLSDYCPNEE